MKFESFDREAVIAKIYSSCVNTVLQLRDIRTGKSDLSADMCLGALCAFLRCLELLGEDVSEFKEVLVNGG